MTIQEAAKRLNLRKLTLAVAVLAGAVLAMFASLLRPLQYSTSSTFIVIQEQRFSDPYTQARSAEYLAGLLARIVDTDTFRNSVLVNTPTIRAYLPTTADSLRRTWSSDVAVMTVADTGLLTLTAYNVEPSAAQAIVAAIGTTLTSDSGMYLGSATPVKLLQIDGPTNSRFPVRPNLGVNMLAGAVLGFVLSAGWFLLGAKLPRTTLASRRPYNWAPSFGSLS
jgi:capsular polysaccharide biosynthesis protein